MGEFCQDFRSMHYRNPYRNRYVPCEAGDEMVQLQQVRARSTGLHLTLLTPDWLTPDSWGALAAQVPDGKFCAPRCSRSQACPAVPGSSGVTAECDILEAGADPGDDPVLCAMVCTRDSHCPGESRCDEVPGTSVSLCMYHGA